mmetsp:Transcript_45573/g.145376  ORF Transcript_45573/g.145376 Transcript_45573/m.145376 type:complete len:273 (+) Transcript_45573:847-1665(+)
MLRRVADDRVATRLHVHRAALTHTRKVVGAADPGVLCLWATAQDVHPSGRCRRSGCQIWHEGAPLGLPEVPLELWQAGVRSARRLREGAANVARLGRGRNEPSVLWGVVSDDGVRTTMPVGRTAVAHIQELVLPVHARVLAARVTAHKRNGGRCINRHDVRVRDVRLCCCIPDVPNEVCITWVSTSRGVVGIGHANLRLPQAFTVDDPAAHGSPIADGHGRARLLVDRTALMQVHAHILPADVAILPGWRPADNVQRVRQVVPTCPTQRNGR